MYELDSIIEVLKVFLVNPWLLVFGGLWVVGYMLKEHSNLNNKLIPWILLVLGGALGIFLIEWSLGGLIIGLLMSYMIIGFYEHLKNSIELLKGLD
ncbi:hypothetical protein CACET_c15850 [Clostridium aceticum]|uniref:Uncharacterized protein n=1 Tax=Clostridium aceticum TaxID=84022 RepID=A0A0D8ID85_9CLOT|nr:phage holin family protein [Clostridium aceticum]AKL95034.1 hypothetical protein CACET_c15850 [Clostridium aceticum]KJF27927.1 hypothetical protein TZ02_04980 [Clostridium aceticum]